MTTEKTGEEINKIIGELRDLKLFNIDDYKKKIRELKKNDPKTYFKAIIMLNLDDEEYDKRAQSAIITPAFQQEIKDGKNALEKKQAIEPAKKIVPKKKESSDFFSQRIMDETLALQKEKERLMAIKLSEQKKGLDSKKSQSINESYGDKTAKKAGQDIFEKKTGLEVKQEQLAKQAKEIMGKAKKRISIGFTLVAISIAAMALITIVGLFLLMNPPEGQAINSLRLGYQLFNELDNVYLNYTFLYNSSDDDYLGKQYYSLKYLTITSAIEQPRRNIISKEQNNFLYYDLTGNMTKIDLNSLQIDNALVLSLYAEAYNLANNYYISESGKETIWTMERYECAPIFFEMNTSKEGLNGLLKLRYEMCLNDNGIPIAIAKEKITADFREVIIAYLESIDSEVKFLSFANKTLAEWENVQIDNH